MKFFFTLLATLFLVAPAWAVDVTMGSNGNLIFEPNDITISAGDTVHFVNGMYGSGLENQRVCKGTPGCWYGGKNPRLLTF